MSKSFTSMGYTLCPFCGKRHDECVLLDRRPKDSLERETLMGVGLCPEHEAMTEEYLLLVPSTDGKSLAAGERAAIKRTSAAQVFNIPTAHLPWVMVHPEVIELLKEMTE